MEERYLSELKEYNSELIKNITETRLIPLSHPLKDEEEIKAFSHNANDPGFQKELALYEALRLIIYIEHNKDKITPIEYDQRIFHHAKDLSSSPERFNYNEKEQYIFELYKIYGIIANITSYSTLEAARYYIDTSVTNDPHIALYNAIDMQEGLSNLLKTYKGYNNQSLNSTIENLAIQVFTYNYTNFPLLIKDILAFKTTPEDYEQKIEEKLQEKMKAFGISVNDYIEQFPDLYKEIFYSQIGFFEGEIIDLAAEAVTKNDTEKRISSLQYEDIESNLLLQPVFFKWVVDLAEYFTREGAALQTQNDKVFAEDKTKRPAYEAISPETISRIKTLQKSHEVTENLHQMQQQYRKGKIDLPTYIEEINKAEDEFNLPETDLQSLKPREGNKYPDQIEYYNIPSRELIPIVNKINQCRRNFDYDTKKRNSHTMKSALYTAVGIFIAGNLLTLAIPFTAHIAKECFPEYLSEKAYKFCSTILDHQQQILITGAIIFTAAAVITGLAIALSEVVAQQGIDKT